MTDLERKIGEFTDGFITAQRICFDSGAYGGSNALALKHTPYIFKEFIKQAILDKKICFMPTFDEIATLCDGDEPFAKTIIEFLGRERG